MGFLGFTIAAFCAVSTFDHATLINMGDKTVEMNSLFFWHCHALPTLILSNAPSSTSDLYGKILSARGRQLRYFFYV